MALASNPAVAVPTLAETLKAATAPAEMIYSSPFVLVTGPQVAQMTDGPGNADAKQRQVAMAIRTLETIGTPEAAKAMPAPGALPAGLRRVVVKVADEKTGAAVPFATITAQSGGFAGRSAVDAKGESTILFPEGKQQYLGVGLEAAGYMRAMQYFNSRQEKDVPATEDHG